MLATDEQIRPYYPLLKPLEGLRFAATQTEGAWRELARALQEESADLEHAERIVNDFVRTPRVDERGFDRDEVPTCIELRMFAKTVSKVPLPDLGNLPAPCPHCAEDGGFWALVERQGGPARCRCACLRGQRLQAADDARKGMVRRPVGSLRPVVTEVRKLEGQK